MEIVYQPIVELPTAKLIGYEALARFNGEGSPDEVFHQAWEAGHGLELETEAFEMAIRNFPADIDEAYPAINASAKTIIATRGMLVGDPGLEIPWPRIVIEVSEKDGVDDYQLLDQPLSLLRQHKTRVAIDDVGAGFSGLTLISQMIPDILKIDRELIGHMDQNPIKRSIVRALVGIARDVRSTVVAEGIETEKEMAACIALGVDCGQGFLFGKPVAFT